MACGICYQGVVQKLGPASGTPGTMAVGALVRAESDPNNRLRLMIQVAIDKPRTGTLFTALVVDGSAQAAADRFAEQSGGQVVWLNLHHVATEQTLGVGYAQFGLNNSVESFRLYERRGADGQAEFFAGPRLAAAKLFVVDQLARRLDLSLPHDFDCGAAEKLHARLVGLLDQCEPEPPPARPPKSIPVGSLVRSGNCEIHLRIEPPPGFGHEGGGYFMLIGKAQFDPADTPAVGRVSLARSQDYLQVIVPPVPPPVGGL